MGYRPPILEHGADARRDLLVAAVVLGAHLDAPEGEVDDELLVRALCAFMDARALPGVAGRAVRHHAR
jgi:hypothetical protein